MRMIDEKGLVNEIKNWIKAGALKGELKNEQKNIR